MSKLAVGGREALMRSHMALNGGRDPATVVFYPPSYTERTSLLKTWAERQAALRDDRVDRAIAEAQAAGQRGGAVYVPPPSLAELLAEKRQMRDDAAAAERLRGQAERDHVRLMGPPPAQPPPPGTRESRLQELLREARRLTGQLPEHAMSADELARSAEEAACGLLAAEAKHGSPDRIPSPTAPPPPIGPVPARWPPPGPRGGTRRRSVVVLPALSPV